MISKLLNILGAKQSLDFYLPNDRTFARKGKVSANIYNLLVGLAVEIARADTKNSVFVNDTNLLETSELLLEWERAFGIPDDCFNELDGLTVQERINQVLFKIRALGVATEQDFIDLAAVIGRTITIERPTTFPRYRFVWLIRGDFNGNYPPYDLPYFFDIVIDPLQCWLEKLKPANTVLLFDNI